MKQTILSFVVVTTAFFSSNILGVSATVERAVSNEFEELMMGLMKGAFQEDFPYTESCFKDGLSIIKTLEIAVDDIKEGTKESVEEGVQLIGDVVRKAARKEIVECETAAKEFGQLIDMAKVLSHPLSFLYHAGHNIVVNHVEIEQEVNAAIGAWDEEPRNFYSVGFNIGEALEQVFVGDKESTSIKEDINEELEEFRRADFEELMKGIMEGAFRVEFPYTESCFKDGLSIVKTLEIAVDDIKAGTKESVEEGVQLIGEIVQEAALKEIVECETAAKEFGQLIDMAKLVSDPLSFLYHAGHNIIVNHVEIEQEVNAAIGAWDEAPTNFYSVGFNIGEALEQVFIGDKVLTSLALE